MEVVLRLGPDMAFLADRTFQGARRQGSDRRGVKLGLTVSDSEALLRALLPLGAGVEIVSPEKLRQQARTLLEKMLEQTRGQRPRERAAAREAGRCRRTDLRERLRRLLLIIPYASRNPGSAAPPSSPGSYR